MAFNGVILAVIILAGLQSCKNILRASIIIVSMYYLHGHPIPGYSQEHFACSKSFLRVEEYLCLCFAATRWWSFAMFPCMVFLSVSSIFQPGIHFPELCSDVVRSRALTGVNDGLTDGWQTQNLHTFFFFFFNWTHDAGGSVNCTPLGKQRAGGLGCRCTLSIYSWETVLMGL